MQKKKKKKEKNDFLFELKAFTKYSLCVHIYFINFFVYHFLDIKNFFFLL